MLPVAESTPNHRRKEVVATIGLDKILRRFNEVELLKLDCEGSEWPILFTSKLLRKVRRVCGEYHELYPIPTPALIKGYNQYTKKELAEFLKARYKTVRIQPHGTSHLGHFWAEDPIPG